VKFLILAPARSGSTLLRHQLNRHPQVCCHGEIYGIHRVLGHSMHASRPLDKERALALRRRDPVRFLDEHVFDSARPVVGFKLLYAQCLQLDFAPVLEHLISMPALRVIVLWRRNLLARHVSEVRLRFGNPGRSEAQTAELIEKSLRPGVVERSCRTNLAARACVHKLFDRQHGLQLDYEDFVAENTRECGRLSHFLGIDPATWPELPAKADAADAALQQLESVPSLRMYRDHA
jgi:hypothetical protein